MLKAYYQLSKYDKNLSVLKTTRKKKSRSFLHHFSQLVVNWMSQQTQQQTVHSFYNGSSLTVVNYLQPAVDAQYESNIQSYEQRMEPKGIVVGTGSTALNINDYQLATLITHGEATASCLEYLGCIVRNYTINAGTNTGSYDLVRLFYNSSGGSITINEVGVVQHTWTGSYSNEVVLTIRDLVAPGFTIDDGEYMKVTYTFQIIS